MIGSDVVSLRSPTNGAASAVRAVDQRIPPHPVAFIFFLYIQILGIAFTLQMQASKN